MKYKKKASPTELLKRKVKRLEKENARMRGFLKEIARPVFCGLNRAQDLARMALTTAEETSDG